MIEPTTACRTERHALCGGYLCSCPCHPGTVEERAKATADAAERYVGELCEIMSSTGSHQGHTLTQVGRCVYCSCGSRYQGSLPPTGNGVIKSEHVQQPSA